MTTVSLSVKRGVDGFTISDVVISNLAPNANDVELRFQLLDSNSVALTKEDVIVRALGAFRTAYSTDRSRSQPGHSLFQIQRCSSRCPRLSTLPAGVSVAGP
jgi:hypothetical protein